LLSATSALQSGDLNWLNDSAATRPLESRCFENKLHGDAKSKTPNQAIASRVRSEKKNTNAKNDTPERLRCRTVEKEAKMILQIMTQALKFARILLPIYPALIRR